MNPNNPLVFAGGYFLLLCKGGHCPSAQKTEPCTAGRPLVAPTFHIPVEKFFLNKNNSY
jgi:hypothetical protein